MRLIVKTIIEKKKNTKARIKKETKQNLQN